MTHDIPQQWPGEGEEGQDLPDPNDGTDAVPDEDSPVRFGDSERLDHQDGDDDDQPSDEELEVSEADEDERDPNAYEATEIYDERGQ